MNKIDIDVVMEVLLEKGMKPDDVSEILVSCQKKAKQAEEEKETKQQQTSDGYIVLVRDKNGVLSDTASALILKKFSCLKTAKQENTEPCLWGIDELDARIDTWMEESYKLKPKAEISNFYDALKKYPKKISKQYGFAFLSKETIPVISVDEGSFMKTMFNFNELSK